MTDSQPSSSVDAATANLQAWRSAWEFALHVAVGTSIFVVIAGAAVVLDVLNRALQASQVSLLIKWGLIFAEYTVFIADLALFTLFVWRAAMRAARKL
jgi:hypothetical protein